MLVDFLGFVGALLLALCGLPQAIDCTLRRSAKGISTPMIIMWFFGVVFMMLYVIFRHGFDLALIMSYVMNIIVVSTMGFWKFRDEFLMQGKEK